MLRSLVFLLVCFAATGGRSLIQAQDAASESREVEASTKDASLDPPLGATTAGQCADDFLTSILEGDASKSHNVSLFRTQLDRRSHAIMLRFGKAADQFRTKFVKTYGADAWQKFNDPNHLPHAKGAAAGANGSVTVLTRDQLATMIEQATQNAKDGKSFVPIPNSEEKLELIKQDGRWFARSETMAGLDDPEQTKKVANLLGSVSVELERNIHAIGRPGLTADDL